MYHSAVEHLARSISPQGWKDVVIAMLTAYFDASGDSRTQHGLVVAGYISSAQQWAEFEKPWLACLEKYGLSYFHMKEINGLVTRCKGHSTCFDHWTAARRTHLVYDLIPVIRCHAWHQFGCGVVNEHFKKLPEELCRNHHLSPYSITVRRCIGAVREYMIREYSINQVMPEIVFEEGGPDWETVERRLIGDEMPVPIRKPKRDKIDKKTGLVMKGLVPLQAADLLAYFVFDSIRKCESGKWEYARTPEINELRFTHGEPGIYDQPSIKVLETEIPALDHSFKVLEKAAHEDKSRRTN